MLTVLLRPCTLHWFAVAFAHYHGAIRWLEPCSMPLYETVSCNNHFVDKLQCGCMERMVRRTEDCNGGSRYRTHRTQAAYGGTCDETMSEQATCNTARSVECIVEPWGLWSACSVTCGAGAKHAHAPQ